MPNKNTIGTAYVQILPSTEGIQGQLEQALGGPANLAGSKAGSAMGGAMSGALGTALKGVGVALGAAATAVGGLVKNAVGNYADFEQLVGGVETLFGSSADTVRAYADAAFQTAGLSANDYMETVTSFSASLLQSLGGDTAAAADYADMAITDMADNANKMGSSMESIQNAYQGFAKQNYTMLDNLKLGYGGTQEEMKRLVKDAERLNKSFRATRDENGKLTLSYSDIVDAIHIVQTEMGITGTTAAEASETISGSVATMQAAWQNLLTGIADENADFDRLVDAFVDSVLTVGDNLLPRIQTALTGAGRLIEGLAPEIAAALPGIVESVAPSLLQTGVSLVGVFGRAVVDSAPGLMTAAMETVVMLAQYLGENADQLAPTAVTLILTLTEALTQPEAISAMTDAGIDLVMGLVDGLIAAMPMLAESAPDLIDHLWTALDEQSPRMREAGVNLLKNLGSGLISDRYPITNAARAIGGWIRDSFSPSIQEATTWGYHLAQNMSNGLSSGMRSVASAAGSLASTIRSYLHFSEPDEGPLADFHTYAPDMVDLFARGIRQSEPLLRGQIESTFDLADMMTAPSYRPETFIPSPTETEVRPTPAESAPIDLRLTLQAEDGTVLGRWLYQIYNDEARRVGTRLAGGIA